jgi:V8-like Glu-specific endopeptidase
MVGLLLLSLDSNSNSISAGTGFLISPDLVLTAAYNVYKLETKTDLRKNGPIYFFPGVDGAIVNKPYRVIDFRIPEEYK